MRATPPETQWQPYHQRQPHPNPTFPASFLRRRTSTRRRSPSCSGAARSRTGCGSSSPSSPVSVTAPWPAATASAALRRRGHDPLLLLHLEAHELTHLRMETEARKIGRNRFFSTRPEHREEAMRSVLPDMRRILLRAMLAFVLGPMSLIGGLCSFVYNCPLDMLIERELRREFPALRASQLLSVSAMPPTPALINRFSRFSCNLQPDSGFP